MVRSMTSAHAAMATRAALVLRPMVATLTARTATSAATSEIRAIAAARPIHQAVSVPSVVPLSSAAGSADVRKATCRANPMTKARIPADAVRAACRRSRDGSHVSIVVIVPGSPFGAGH